MIREANADDAPAMIECRNRDSEQADLRMPAYFRGEHNPQHAMTPRIGFVAVDNGTVVGYIAGHLTTRHGCAGELQYLFVASAYRRRGIGTALIRRLASWFQFRNANDVCIALAADSPKEAKPFFESLGATPLKKHWYHWEEVGRVNS